MAGTISGLGLSQRVDVNGKPDIGWLLYLYAANSSTPVTAYKDTALTAGLELPWPIEADSNGMIPIFWLADGSYRARATSKDGSRSFFDIPTVLALGASAGAAPSGSVDPNAIFLTGRVMWQPVSGTLAGWVRDNGRTLGSATSGATERANSDSQVLFEFLWNTYTDAQCAVLTGRGANSASDWSANKQITLLDMRGRLPVGLDDMGNSAASRFTGVPFTTGDELTAASLCGEATHVTTTAELAAHTHTITDPTHFHNELGSVTTGGGLQNVLGGNNQVTPVAMAGSVTAAASTGITGTNSSGSGTAHNNMPPAITGTWYRKL